MATVRAYSVCQSDVINGAAVRQQTVYSYQPGQDLQDDSPLAFAANTPEDAMRTGLSPAYCHGGAATSDAEAIGYANTGGLTPTLISAAIGAQAAAFPAATGAGTDVDNFTAGTGNALLANCARIVCNTTNIGDTTVGAGLQVAVSTTGSDAGVPTLIDAPNRIVAGGNGYANDGEDLVALDGFPGCTMTVTV